VTDRKNIGEKARDFFEDLWKRGDPWSLESSPFEQAKYAHQLGLLHDRRYSRALEIGCGSGQFTRILSRVVDGVTALDISQTAIDRARGLGIESEKAAFVVANIMDYDLRAEGPWDLIVMSETIYYLGWLYSFFNVSWLASELFTATTDSGRLLMANTFGVADDYLVRPWIIRTYRDLFLNTGYRIENEEIFKGTKNNVEIEVIISLFNKMGRGG
jgi:SAM-dependent methyltransferase